MVKAAQSVDLKSIAVDLREIAQLMRDYVTTRMDATRLEILADQLDPPPCPHKVTTTDYEVGSGRPFYVYCATCGEKLSGPH